MSPALVRKALRDARLLLCVVVPAAILFEALYVFFVREILREFEHDIAMIFLQKAFVRKLIASGLGAELGSRLTATSLMTIGFSHPLLNALSWLTVLTVGTRQIVAEIDRGTADLLFTLPVSRARLYGSATVALLIALALMSVAPVCGAWLGRRLTHLDTLDVAALWLLAANLAALHIAIGGLTLLAASLCSRRGPAIGLVLGVILFSVLIQVLVPFWEPARWVDFLSLLHYYRPLPAVTSGQLPVRDILTLVSVGIAAGVLGLLWFRRRDIPAA